jgi:hypothetical protein
MEKEKIMLIRGSPHVIALIQAKAAELQATRRRENGKAALLRGGAISLVVLALGGAGWLGCAGYDRLIGSEKRAQEHREYEAQRTKEDAERNAAFLSSIKSMTIPVKGVVTLADGQRVMLADGGHVTASGIVGVSPDSTVRAVMPEMPRPTAAQIQADAKPDSGAPVVSNFVIFKKVPYATGEVQTGWQFADSNAKAPAFQWCLFVAEEPDNTRREIRLGLDGRRVDLPNASPFSGVDLQAAFASCVWSRGAATDARAPVNRQDSPPSPHIITARKG